MRVNPSMCPPFPASLPPSIRADYKIKVKKKLFFTTLEPVWSPRNAKQGRKVELSEGLNSNAHCTTHRLSDLGAVMGRGSPRPTPSISLLICQIIRLY